MRTDFGNIVINEVPDLVGRDQTECRPAPEGSDRRLLANRENPGKTETNDVGNELFMDADNGRSMLLGPCQLAAYTAKRSGW